MSTFGQAIVVSLFGESHGPAIGLTLHQLPPGLFLDIEAIQKELTKRRPKSALSTARQEKDELTMVSGVFEGYTTGAPLTILIANADVNSKDYHPEVLRPSTADYTAQMKYFGYQDYRGSGHFSGRLTAPLVVLGAIAKQYLRSYGIEVVSHIQSIKNIKDISFYETKVTPELLHQLSESDFPVIHPDRKELMEKVILDAKSQLDSVGGTIETIVTGVPVGLGNPFFDKMEAIFGHLILSIPAVKGIHFGYPLMDQSYGSEINDAFVFNQGKVETSTNYSGGIQGGITNGMPIIFTTSVKPTASIAKPQATVNQKSLETTTLELHGRHDPAIVHRALHVVNALTYYAMFEQLMKEVGAHGFSPTKKRD